MTRSLNIFELRSCRIVVLASETLWVGESKYCFGKFQFDCELGHAVREIRVDASNNGPKVTPRGSLTGHVGLLNWETRLPEYSDCWCRVVDVLIWPGNRVELSHLLCWLVCWSLLTISVVSVMHPALGLVRACPCCVVILTENYNHYFVPLHVYQTRQKPLDNELSNYLQQLIWSILCPCSGPLRNADCLSFACAVMSNQVKIGYHKFSQE